MNGNGNRRNKKNNPKVEIKCLHCGIMFKAWQYEKNRKYCSRKCLDLHKIISIKKKCIVCDIEYNVIPCEKDSIFCSPKCKGKYKHQHLSEKRACLFCGKEFSVALSAIKKGRGKYCSRECKDRCPQHKKLMLETMKNNRKNHSSVKRNKIEIKLNNIINDLKLPYKFVGNGDVWIAGLNPDFININGQKKIVELFGEYWHKKPDTPYYRTEVGRKKIFSEYGYNTLIVWSEELRNPEVLKQKLLSFNNI
jgi:hypothetical protein